MPYIATKNPYKCQHCGFCEEYVACSSKYVGYSDECVGCGACVMVCPENALTLVRRPEEEIKPIYKDERDWMEARAEIRGIDIKRVL